MPIKTNTLVKRIPLDTQNLNKAIKQECEIQSARKAGRRLAAAFVAADNVVLIFQVSPD